MTRVGIARSVSAVIVVLLVAAACSTSDDGQPVTQIATLETTAPLEQAAAVIVTADSGDADAVDNDAPAGADGGSDAGDEPVTFEDAALDFADCMRDTGFPQWPDPNPGDRVRDLFQTDLEALGIDRNDADFRDAIDACRSAFDGVAGAQDQLDADQRAAFEDAVLDIFTCVRSKPGYAAIPDPDFTAPGGPRAAFANVFASGEFPLAETLEEIEACRIELGYPAPGQNG